MQVEPNVLSIRSAGIALEGVGADSVSWITSGERTWTSIVMRSPKIQMYISSAERKFDLHLEAVSPPRALKNNNGDY